VDDGELLAGLRVSDLRLGDDDLDRAVGRDAATVGETELDAAGPERAIAVAHAGCGRALGGLHVPGEAVPDHAPKRVGGQVVGVQAADLEGEVQRVALPVHERLGDSHFLDVLLRIGRHFVAHSVRDHEYYGKGARIPVDRRGRWR